MREKYKDYNIPAHINWIEQKPKDDDAFYLEGTVVTYHGAVFVYSDTFAAGEEYSELMFPFRGIMYKKSFDKRYSEHGLIIEAKKFVEEIVKDL